MNYVIWLRESGHKKHVMLGGGKLVEQRIHALHYEKRLQAEDAATWMLSNNEALDSAQVVHVETGKIVARFGATARAGDRYTQIPLYRIYEAVTGRETSGTELVRCPAPDHNDGHPSCTLSERRFRCAGCGSSGENRAFSAA